MGKGSKAASKQPKVGAQLLPLLQKPTTTIGAFIEIQGRDWGGCPAAEKDKWFKCAVRAFDAIHTFPGNMKSAGFQVQEMGQSGEGSLEPGVASGDVFWITYPHPFLKYFYKANPEKLPDGHKDKPVAAVQSPSALPDATAAAPTASPTGLPVVQQDAAVYSMFDKLSDELCCTAGPKFGKRQQVWQCNITVGDHQCGTKRTLTFDRPNKVPPNSNLTGHVREAAKSGCSAHAAALETLNESSKHQVLVNGKYEVMHSFEEAFPHHIDYVMMVATGEISAVTGQKPKFRSYVRGACAHAIMHIDSSPLTCLLCRIGYEPRATFPHHETQHRIAECIAELQSEEQDSRRTASRKEFGGLPHRGWQLDMWTDTATHTSYACITETDVQEPSAPYLKKLKAEELPQLLLRSGVVAFEQFPQSEHTGANIRDWIRSVAAKKKVVLAEDLTGICPDGAADGQCALNSMEELAEKTDTCDLHRMQRAVLYATGDAGTQSQNPACKALLRKESRLVTLSNQSRAVNSDIRESQIAADIPPHKILMVTRKGATRWGGTFMQISQNHLMHPVLDPAVEKYKRQNRGKQDAIVESDESESSGANRVGRAVAAAELGMSVTEWDEGIEMEAFLERPYQTKELIEKGKKGAGLITGAQSLMLMHSLRASCEVSKPLTVKLLPASPSLADRQRTLEQRNSISLGPCVVTAREIMITELNSRFFIERPSNSRMVQLHMSKQMRSTAWLPEAWRVLCETLYLSWLRKASNHLKSSTVQLRSSPNKRHKTTASSSTSLVLFDEDEVEETLMMMDDDEDDVAVEVERWKSISPNTISAFKDKETGMLNEFAFMWAKRKEFPLHYFVFRQTASHLPHEGNVEQIFSLGGRLSDPNMNPAYLAILVYIGMNSKVYMPPTKDIFQRYLRKFSKAGKLLDADGLGFADEPTSPPIAASPS